MPGDGGGLRNGPAHFEQTRDALMAQIAEMQIFDAEQRAGAREGSADGRMLMPDMKHIGGKIGNDF